VQQNKHYRLNPFALPPETNARYLLLVASALILTFTLGYAFAVGVLGLGTTTNLDDIIGSTSQRIDSLALQVRSIIGVLCVSLIPVGIMLLSAQFILRRHPKRLQKRLKLEEWPSNKDQKFQDRIAQLSQDLQLKTTPVVYTPRGSKKAEGQAFGLPPTYAIKLGGGMPLVMRKQPAIFRAIVLHELAHIVNGDVRRTYFTQALWLAVIVLIFVPFGLVSTFVVVINIFWLLVNNPSELLSYSSRGIPFLFTFIFQLVVLAGLFTVIRSSVLRVRESYADWIKSFETAAG